MISKEQKDSIENCASLLERTANCMFSIFNKKENRIRTKLLKMRDSLNKEMEK